MPLQREDPRGPYHTALFVTFFAGLAVLGGVGSRTWWLVGVAGGAFLVSGAIALQRGMELRRELAREKGALLAGMRSTRR